MFDGLRDSGSRDGAFAARWHAPPPRFAPWAEPACGDGPDALLETAEPAVDPAEAHWQAGYRAGRAETEADLADGAAAMDALLRALDRLAPLPPAAFMERLEQDVRQLLLQLVGTATVDEDLLRSRCAALAALAGPDAGAVLYAHPADAAMLAAVQPDLSIGEDPQLPRGELRLIDGAGEAASGPHTMLADWAAQTGDSHAETRC